MINEKIFKAYDVRAIYGTELTDEAAYAIGRAFAQFIYAKTIAIGRDNRESSPTLFREVARGIQDSGVDVIDIGLVSTPMMYYVSSHLNVEGAIMITASHNPKEYNGIKICRKNAESIGLNNGLEEIKKIAIAEDFVNSPKVGTLTSKDIQSDYFTYMSNFADIGDNTFSIVADTANAMGSVELGVFKNLSSSISVKTLFENLDSTFPNHEANPAKHETLAELQKSVVENHADMGIAYDGDADRIGIVDELGNIIPSDIVFGIIIPLLLEQKPGATLLYDLRSSKVIPEIIDLLGGKSQQCAVGGTNIKQQMREVGGYAGAEISGHFFYSTLSYSDSSTLTVLLLLNTLAKTGKKLSELASKVQKYYNSGEINFTVIDTVAVLSHFQETYKDGDLNTLDGIKISYDDWWFSIRSSNTEPLIRLVLEANSEELMLQKKEELTSIMKTLNV